jgi:hypothetical protein
MHYFLTGPVAGQIRRALNQDKKVSTVLNKQLIGEWKVSSWVISHLGTDFKSVPF